MSYSVGPTENFTAGAAIARHLRVKLSSGKLAVAAAEDADIGTIEDAAFADGDSRAVRLKNAQGTAKMIAAGAVTQFADVYGAAGGKVDDVANENYVGVALEAAAADGDAIKTLRMVRASDLDSLGPMDGNILIDEDFIGDWPAAATALSGQGRYAWTKTETNGLGVISSDEARGVVKHSFDAVIEAATATLFMENSPLDPAKAGTAEFTLAVFDIGDNAALDIDFGLASDDHATDFEAIAEFVAFHLDGTDLSLKCHSDDGTTDTAPVDSTVDLVDNTYYVFKIDFSDLADVKFYYRALGASQWTRLAGATTFDVSAATAKWTPIVMVEKTSDDTTADVRCDRIRVQAARL